MITGVIKTRDIFLHPILVIRLTGWTGFFKLIRKGLSRKTYHFIDNCIEITAKHFIGPTRQRRKANH